MEESDYWQMRLNEEIHQIQIYYEDIGYAAIRPSTIYKPRLSIDGDMWCALYGDNLQDGVAGFGKSPSKAFEDFDKSWRKDIGG